jgi:hypothetical protein
MKNLKLFKKLIYKKTIMKLLKMIIFNKMAKLLKIIAFSKTKKLLKIILLLMIMVSLIKTQFLKIFYRT